jgi:NADH-quinone oxidoreductase subunit E
MEQQTDFAAVDGILEHYGTEQKNLITVLQCVQSEHRYLPREILEYIAEKMDISLAKIYSVATFYENFSLDPKGKYVIKICDGTACHVRKSIPILQKVRETLGVSADKPTTDDMMFTVETVSCLGACGLAPVMTLNDKVYPAMTPEKAVDLLNGVKKEEESND